MLKKRIFHRWHVNLGLLGFQKSFFLLFRHELLIKKLECWISLSLGNKGHSNVYFLYEYKSNNREVEGCV